MKRFTKTAAAAAVLALLAAWLAPAGKARAQGMMIPDDPSIEPLELRSHRVKAKIAHGAAETTVTQVFYNGRGSSTEAVYVFPLPDDAAISDFSLWIDGKKKKGEILDKKEALGIYQNIVSRMKDPGLLEYAGGKLFKARIFPVPPLRSRKVEISFTQTLSAYENLYKYVYPLKTSGEPAETKKDFTFTATLKAARPIKSIYSPSHAIEVQWNGKKEAVVGFEKNRALLNRNFILYFNVTKDRVGMSLLAHKRDKKKGSFLLMLSPGAHTKDSETVNKNVTFVIDTSGSMNGEKMKGAKKALAYCLEKLGTGETFNVVRFSSTSQLFFDHPVPAVKENKEEALEMLESMNAAGGTAIESALRLAFSQSGSSSGAAHYVLFITDGMPTVGTTDPEKIVKMTEELNKSKPGTKIFSFGLGDDVNANFLDLVSETNHGASHYAESGEKLGLALERFHGAVAHPAMTDVTLAVKNIRAEDVFPRDIPDIFYGEQLTVAGRYLEGGTGKVVLKGRIGKKVLKITYTRSFPTKEKDNEFIEHIWATRKVGYLLDQIRLNGEDPELKDEVVALAQKYGIVTPYTSYLVVEDDIGPLPEGPVIPPMQPYPGPVYPYPPPYPAGSGGGFGLEDQSLPAESYSAYASLPAGELKKHEAMKSLAESSGSLSSDKAKGKDGARMSEVLSDMKNADTQAPGLAKLVSGRLLVYRSGRWIDSKFKKDMDILEIEFGSTAYFTLLDVKPGLKKILALGTDVVVVVGEDRAISVKSAGGGNPSKKQIKKFLK